MEPKYLNRNEFEFLLEKGNPDFTNSYVKGETFKNVAFLSIHGISFINCNFENVKMFEMEQVKFQHCGLKECDMYHSNLKSTSFWQCYLNGCDLTGANLTEGALARSSFVNTSFSGVDLSKATLERCEFESITLSDPIKGIDSLQFIGNDSQIGNCLLSLRLEEKQAENDGLPNAVTEAMQRNIESLVAALEAEPDVDPGVYERTCRVIQEMRAIVSDMNQHSSERKEPEESTYRYYSTHRPIAPGTYPDSSNVVTVVNFDDRKYVEGIGRKAWGYLDYKTPLADEDRTQYELIYDPIKYDSKKELKIAGYRPTKELAHTMESVNLAFQKQLSVSDIRYLCSFKNHFTNEGKVTLEKAATAFRDQERRKVPELEP